MRQTLQTTPGSDAPELRDGRAIATPPPDRPLRVVLASMAPFVGGAEVAAERLALGLRGDGHDVTVALGTPGAVLERMSGQGLRCVHRPMYLTDKWRWPRYARARHGLRRLLARHRPDVIHSNDLPTHQIVSDAARGLGIPRICHHRFPFEGAAIDWLNKFGAERHLFVSAALMDEMCRASARLALSPRAVVHDGLPLPPAPTDRDRAAARDRLGLPHDRALVVFTGQVIERKGVADLIRAWSLLDPSAASAAELVIVGDDVKDGGRYRHEMEALARRSSCPARFVGFQEDVWPWLTAADVAVVPSHVEPLGNATLEAMACGLPVIGAEVGGIPEMVRDGATGLLVPPRAPDALSGAIGRLILDRGLRERLGRSARLRCEHQFSLERHVRSVLEQYRIALADHPGVARL